MENIVKDLASLDERLAFLQVKKQQQWEEIKMQKDALVHSLSPSVLLKKAVNSFKPGQPNASTALDWITGIVAGAVTRKVYAPKKAGWLRKITAPWVQLFVTGFVKNKVAKFQEKKTATHQNSQPPDN